MTNTQKWPVVAAIVNYNMADELQHVLSQVVGQGYDEIFVLDDASTDDSRKVASKFKNVKLIAGKTNKGAGANRNRIIGALKHSALIHFLDADVDLQTKNTAELVRQVAPKEPFGFVGGLIKTAKGKRFAWNYGDGPGLSSSLGSQLQMLTFSRRPWAKVVRRPFKGLLSSWPNPFAEPVRREIYWCAEANMIVRSDIFAKLGGFDEIYRETEILEFAMRLHKLGLKCYFDPRLSVRHTEGKVRHYNRDLVKIRELIKVNRLYRLSK